MSDDEDNSNNNSNDFIENEDDEEYSEIDEERPTLIQIDRKIAKIRKE